MLSFFVGLIYCLLSFVSGDNSFMIQIQATPTRDDQYCVGLVKPPESFIGKTIIGFQPLPGWAAHHMILFTCSGSISMENRPKDECASTSYPCGPIQFVWAHGGNPLWLPPKVGLTITSTTYFAIQLHYGMRISYLDHSGVRLHTAPTVLLPPQEIITWLQPKVWLLAPNIFPGIHPGQKLALVGNEKRTVSQDLIVFAVRAHAHDRGVYNEVKARRNGQEFWIYHRDTQLAQSFIPLPNYIHLKVGDELEFVCAYDTSGESRIIQQGATKRDEMCNVYLMHYLIDSSGQQEQQSNNEIVDKGEEEEEEENEVNEINTSLKCEASTPFLDIPIHSQIVGISTNDKKAYIFHRGNIVWDDLSFTFANIYRHEKIHQDVLMEINLETGKVIKTFGGDQFYLPHSVKIDPFQENIIWLADVGSHVVTEYDVIKHKPIRIAGTMLTPGSTENTFCKPTDLAFTRDKIFISDGYCNSRVVVLKRSDLSFIEQVNDLNLPHALAISNCDGGFDYLAIAEREAGKVKVLNVETLQILKTIGSWDHQFLPFAVGFDQRKGQLFVGLVKRTIRQRDGAVWVAGESICEMEGEDTLKGETICENDKIKLKEPHMFSISGKRLFIAEAVDMELSGNIFEIAI